MSINDLMASMNTKRNTRAPEGQIDNPDIPERSSLFTGESKGSIMNDQVNIRDQAMSALKLQSEPRNGNFFRLPRTAFSDNPKEDAFLQNDAIDPNVIRKRIDPDSAIPTLQNAESTLFSLVPDNLRATDSNDLITKANERYLSYKNRHGQATHRNDKPIHTFAFKPQPKSGALGNAVVQDDSPDTLPEGIIQRPEGPDAATPIYNPPPLYNGDIPQGGIPLYQKPPLSGVRPSVRKPISANVPTLGHI